MNTVSRSQRQAMNRILGVGLAVFIALYIAATICFIILE
jgi:uncharacterized membrane protein YgaE (UPF0421/DUF939 family)